MFGIFAIVQCSVQLSNRPVSLSQNAVQALPRVEREVDALASVLGACFLLFAILRERARGLQFWKYTFSTLLSREGRFA